MRVGVVTAWGDLGAVRKQLLELIKEHKPESPGWFPNWPVAALMADLLIMKGVKRVELKGVDVSAACQGFAEQVSSRQLVHGNDPLLTPTSSAARSCPAETAGGLPRRVGNVDAAYAAAGAVHLARIAPKP